MAQFQAFAPGVEVNGQTVLAVVAGMAAFKQTAEDILTKHGIKSPTQAGWYPQQAWLDAFRDIAKSIGPKTLNQIGRSIPQNAKFPPGIDTVEKALSSIDAAYHMNHRGGQIGSYAYKKTGERSGVVECRNPYPCDFDSGLIEAMIRRFAPAGTMPKVQHEPGKPCRAKQGDSCTYVVSW